MRNLVVIPEIKLRHRADAERDTALDVAERLHWITMVVADLMGSHSEFSVRR